MKSSENVNNSNMEPQDQYERDMRFDHNIKKIELDEDTVFSTALILMVAGYDTTGMMLSFMGYFLSMHPDVQIKLQDEIKHTREMEESYLILQ